MNNKGKSHAEKQTKPESPTQKLTAPTNEASASHVHPHVALQRALNKPAPTLTPADIISLQQTVGNKAVLRMLKDRTESRDANPRPQPIIQAKLTVGAAGDKHEQEADRVARQVMSMEHAPDAAASLQRETENEPLPVQRLTTPLAPPAQREMMPDEEAQLKPDAGGNLADSFELSGHVEQSLSAQRGGGSPLPDAVRNHMEPRFGANFSGVRVHTNVQSDQLNRALHARAFTTGQDIFFSQGAYNPSTRGGQELIAHELTHVVQQTGGQNNLHRKPQPDAARARPTANASPASAPPDVKHTASPTLALRDALRISPAAPTIQRDIIDSKRLTHGKFQINFTKNEATVAGGLASEDGTVKFTPNAKAPESDSIRFVQIVRTFDTAAGGEFNWAGSPEAPRSQMQTVKDRAKGIVPGFYVDQIAATLNKRTKSADPAVVPYYDAMLPNPGNQIGKRRGANIVPAILDDHPSYSNPLKYSFVTSAKASDTGTWYGSVVWGFEVYQNKAGVAKIKGEYSGFREGQGATTDAALKAFDEHYRNPGSSTAP